MATFDCTMIPIRDRRVLSKALDGSERTEAGLNAKDFSFKMAAIINNGRGTIDYHYVCAYRVCKALSQRLKWLTHK